MTTDLKKKIDIINKNYPNYQLKYSSDQEMEIDIQKTLNDIYQKERFNYFKSVYNMILIYLSYKIKINYDKILNNQELDKYIMDALIFSEKNNLEINDYVATLLMFKQIENSQYNILIKKIEKDIINIL